MLTSQLQASQLLAMGVPPEVFTDPSYVPVRGCVADSERFDAELFGISPREAELIDPQHRLMLEATWSALEDAGVNPLHDRLRTAVFAAASPSRYQARILSRPEVDADVIDRITVGAGRDFMASRIAYRLGLRGPAIGVLTACSSSLVGVHLAVQALNNGDCDQAVVVAASLGWPQAGYRYVRGGIMAVDGVCRPFDAGATGVVGGSGVAAVVLRRYQDVRTEVPGYGVIVGSAVNNDGASRAGFNAPSAQGQAAAIRAALHAGDIPASALGYLEAHGTGTHVGDPIEWSAASSVLRVAGVADGQVAVGAVKANIGHLDAAAGLAGLVKALLVLKSGQIPPVANFDQLNPLLGGDGSPLRVPTRREDWVGPEPRRAGVSSFGIGGTNAHVIVEQALADPASAAPSTSDVRPRVVVLSAVRAETLDRAATGLAEHIERTGPALADLAFTLHSGRFALPERLAVVGRDRVQLVRALRDGGSVVRGRVPATGPRPLVFLLPGQGTQRPDMARPFLDQLPGFDDALAECLGHFDPALAARVGAAVREPDFPAAVRATGLSQPALFAVEYAAARALDGLGLQPAAVAGHSLGELTAAYLAGLLDLPAAAALVTLRSQAMQECPPGAMLAVTCAEEEAQALVAAAGGRLALAAANGAANSVLSGASAAIDDLERALVGRFPTRRLDTSHAFHSELMAPAVRALRAHLADRRGGPVTVPMMTNVDGGLLEPGAEVPLELFAASAGATVRFGDGLRTLLLRFPGALAVEVGPGQALSGMAVAAGMDAVPLAPVRRGRTEEGPAHSLAALWVQGQPVDLAGLTPAGRRCYLPVSPLAGRRHVAPEAEAELTAPAAAVLLPASREPGRLVAPADEVLAAWRDLLGHPDPSRDADFIGLGGDSLTVIRLARRLENVFPVEIALADLTSARTLGDQIDLIERLMAARGGEVSVG